MSLGGSSVLLGTQIIHAFEVINKSPYIDIDNNCDELSTVQPTVFEEKPHICILFLKLMM